MYKAQTEKGQEMEDRAALVEIFINPWGLVVIVLILAKYVF
jgi:hypothetical protein